jgi:hypothetical protein
MHPSVKTHLWLWHFEVDMVLRALAGRLILGMIFLAITTAVGSLKAGGGFSSDSGSSNKNPWSKDYVAPKPSATQRASVFSDAPSYHYVNKRTGEPATDEELRDEAYRQKLLREMRENYENRHGVVDTSSM